MFFPQLEINMDWRQNCLIDLHFSRFSLCNISLSPITADLLQVSVDWLFCFPFLIPGSGRNFFSFIYLIFCNFRGRFSLHIHSLCVNALIKNGMISQRIERENVFWLASLFVCFCCLLFSPVHVLETICMEHNFSRVRNIRTVILHVNWFILIKKKTFWWKGKHNVETVGVWGTYFMFHVEAPPVLRKSQSLWCCIWIRHNFEICKVNQ